MIYTRYDMYHNGLDDIYPLWYVIHIHIQYLYMYVMIRIITG